MLGKEERKINDNRTIVPRLREQFLPSLNSSRETIFHLIFPSILFHFFHENSKSEVFRENGKGKFQSIRFIFTAKIRRKERGRNEGGTNETNVIVSRL